MRFMVPRGRLHRWWRNFVLRASVISGAFRRRVDSGRLAEPFTYADSPVVDHGHADPGLPEPGSVAPDSPLDESQLLAARRLRELIGSKFVLLLVGGQCEQVERLCRALVSRGPRVPLRVLASAAGEPLRADTGISDATGTLDRLYAQSGPRAWLIRPDGHLAATRPLDERLTAEAVSVLLAAAVGGGSAQ
jgi:hypothetical protein